MLPVFPAVLFAVPPVNSSSVFTVSDMSYPLCQARVFPESTNAIVAGTRPDWVVHLDIEYATNHVMAYQQDTCLSIAGTCTTPLAACAERKNILVTKACSVHADDAGHLLHSPAVQGMARSLSEIVQQLFSDDQLSRECAKALSLQLGGCDVASFQQLQGVLCAQNSGCIESVSRVQHNAPDGKTV